MFIICKSCKKLVDTNKYDFCPRCGSNFNYGDNLTVANHTADYEEYERRMAEQQRTAVENRMNNPKELTRKETQRRLKNQANQAQGKKNGCSGCVAAVIVAFCFLGGLMGVIEEEEIDLSGLFGDEYSKVQETVEKYIEEEIPTDIYIDLPDELTNYTDTENTEAEEEVFPSYFAVVGETVYTENYAVTCTRVSLYESEFMPLEDGYKYISFDIVMENTSGRERSFFESVSCTVDGEKMPQTGFSGVYFPGMLKDGEKYEKSVIFKIPEDALYFDICYGDDVMIFTGELDIEGYSDEYSYDNGQYDY